MNKFIISVAIVSGLLLSGCATKDSTVIIKPSPVATVGDDLNTVATKAIAAFKEYKDNGAGLTWSLSTAFNSYRDLAKLGTDVKALIKAWTGSKGEDLSKRIEILFDTSSGTPEQKMETLAKAAETAASTP